MGTKRTKDGSAGKTITFDQKARHAFITGFRKRKQQRRREGRAQVVELERQDRINVKWEVREDVKRTWKEVQWAERRVEKLFGPDGPLHLKNRANTESDDDEPKPKRKKAAALEDGEVEEGAETNKEGQEVVAFGVEDDDDDPFGGCEVTTTVGDGSLALTTSEGARDASAFGRGSWFSESPMMLALLEKRNAGRDLAHPGMTPAEHAARIKRRTEALRKEEAIRQASIAKRVKREMSEKKKKKKKKTSKKGEKKKKPTAKERRRRKMK